MVEILVEELTRYQDISLAEDIPVFPTEEDLWQEGKTINKCVAY